MVQKGKIMLKSPLQREGAGNSEMLNVCLNEIILMPPRRALRAPDRIVRLGSLRMLSHLKARVMHNIGCYGNDRPFTLLH